MTQMEFRKIRDDDVKRIRDVSWPACQEILHEAVEKMQNEMEKAAPSDGAYNLISALILHEVFFRQTVVAAIDRGDPVMSWVKQEWVDWDNK